MILTCIGIAKQGKKAIGNPTISGQKTDNLSTYVVCIKYSAAG
jgi:hypothetical protein